MRYCKLHSEDSALSTDLDHRSFRLPATLIERLRARAVRTDRSQTQLVARYLDEGMRMDEYPLIVFRDGPMGRRAMLEGSRLEVAQIVETVRAEGGSVDAAAAYLSLPTLGVRACMRYYADHREEIDAYAKAVAAENERLQQAWEREQAALR